MAYLRFFTLLALFTAVDGSTGTSCVKSLSEISSAEYFRDETMTATYTLCPNTIFLINDPKSNSSPSSEESPALHVRKSNIHVKCGDDGASSNNCIFTGGSYQLSVDRPSRHGAIYNVIVQGVTFRAATVNNVVASASGTLSLKDCIFKNNDNDAVIVASPPFRNQDKAFGPSLLVRIAESAFLNNRLESGLAVFDTTSAEITDSVFAGSSTRRPLSVPTYLLRVEHGDLMLKDSCFFGNDETITPIATNRAIAQSYGSFYQRRGSGLPLTGCHFMAEVTRGSLDEEDFEQSQFNCYAPSSTHVCMAKDYNLTSVDHSLFPCETSLNDIYQNEETLDDSSFVRTYILCPQKTYSIGSLDAATANSKDMSVPLVFGRPNVHIVCGVDGKSSNNCELEGGNTQVRVMYAFTGASASIDNSLIQGVTFTKGQNANIVIDSPCNLFIKKCIFTENQNSAVIKINSDTENANNSDRRVTVIESAFAGNTMGSKPGSSTGLIVNMGGSLRVIDSAFLGNEDMKVDSRFSSYIVGNINGELEMTGNCFVGNEIDFAAAINHSPHQPVLSNNYGPERSDEQCNFVSVTDPATTSTDFSCIGFDRPTCYLKRGFSVGYSDEQDTQWTVKVEVSASPANSELCAAWIMVFLAVVCIVRGL